jgi:hypothetical protein
MIIDWRFAAKTIDGLLYGLGGRGVGFREMLVQPEIRDALEPFNTEQVHSYLRCRIARGLGVPQPKVGESEKTFAAALVKLAGEDVDTWAVGIGMGLVLAVPVPITLSLVQRQRREFSQNGVQYRRHEMMLGSLRELCVEKECSILFGEAPLYPYAIRTGDADYVKVGEATVSLLTVKNSGWVCKKQFWIPKRADPARANIERLTVIADAVRCLGPLRQSIIQVSLDWPSVRVELQTIVSQIENASAAIDDLRFVKETRPTIDKVRALLDEAATGMRTLRHKPGPSGTDAGLRAVSVAMSSARPALKSLGKLVH